MDYVSVLAVGVALGAALIRCMLGEALRRAYEARELAYEEADRALAEVSQAGDYAFRLLEDPEFYAQEKRDYWAPIVAVAPSDGTRHIYH